MLYTIVALNRNNLPYQTVFASVSYPLALAFLLDNLSARPNLDMMADGVFVAWEPLGIPAMVG